MIITRSFVVTAFCLTASVVAMTVKIPAVLAEDVPQIQISGKDNQEQAKVLYQQAIEYVRDSKNIQANQQKIIDLLTQSANLNYAPAQVDLGKIYYFGFSGKKSDPDALLWFKKAAEQGDAKGQYQLGQMYTEGKGGLKESEKDASIWYEKSAKQGYAPAQYYLAILYLTGIDGIDKDPEKAIDLLKKATAQGDQEAAQLLSKLQPVEAVVPPVSAQ